MAAPKGNQFWKARSKHGRDKIFSTPEILWEACQEYFQWVEDNPLKEEKATQFQGEFIKTDVNKMRAMTLAGLCLFLDIDHETWSNYKTYREDGKDFLGVIKKAEQIIYNQKFTGASADLLNANIIARDLGLSDKKELHGNPDKPLRVIASEMSAEEATEIYRQMIKDGL